MEIRTYRDLIVWQKAMDLVIEAYKICSKFPKEEQYALSQQIKRAVVSIPSNIAEGKAKGTKKDYRHYLQVAYGSGAELETQLEIASRLHYVPDKEYKNILELLSEIMKMLRVLIIKLA